MCDKEFSADTFEQWFQAMHAHYMTDHADFMNANVGKPKEEGMKWMADMKQKFEAASAL